MDVPQSLPPVDPFVRRAHHGVSRQREQHPPLHLGTPSLFCVSLR